MTGLALAPRGPADEVPVREVARLMGVPVDRDLDGPVADLATGARAWYAQHGRPWTDAREIGIDRVDGDAVVLSSGERLAGPGLAARFRRAEASSAIVACASAGPEVGEEAARLWREDRPDEAFALDRFGAAVVEHLVRALGARECARVEPAGLTVLPHMSPGYDGWPLADQVVLFRLLGAEAGGARPGAIEMRESGMLWPTHSLLALFGLTRRGDLVGRIADLCPCTGCGLAACGYRRAPFSGGEAAASIRTPGASPAPAAAAAAPVAAGPLVEKRAAYRFPERALRRWAENLLALEYRADGSVAAGFTYRGSTCSGGGVPLEFRYSVETGPARDGYPIRASSCVPAPGDDGHRATCRFQAAPHTFLGAITPFRALDGRPLDAVLDWRPESNPAGCLCSQSQRNHKWAVVYETLHFALRRGQGEGGK